MRAPRGVLPSPERRQGWLPQRGDLRVVMEILGHKNLSTTSIYLRRANLAQMRTAMAGRDYTTAA